MTNLAQKLDRWLESHQLWGTFLMAAIIAAYVLAVIGLWLALASARKG